MEIVTINKGKRLTISSLTTIIFSIRLFDEVFPGATGKETNDFLSKILANSCKKSHRCAVFCDTVVKKTNSVVFAAKKRCGQVRFQNFVAIPIP